MIIRFLLVVGMIQALETVAVGQAGQAPVAASDTKGLAPRATPADYQAHAQAGDFTIAAEFEGHSVSTGEAIYSTEDYVTIEIGLFGPPDTPLKISTEDFSLRINGKKVPSPAQQYTLVFASLKDPEWEPPAAPAKSKGGITGSGGGGKGNADEPPSAPPPMPMSVRRAMQQRVQKAALREGDRVLPEAGLIFIQHRGKLTAKDSVELIYSGAAGKAVLTLNP
jgi:hypothetical protein